MRTVPSLVLLLLGTTAWAEEKPAKPPTDFSVLPELAESIAKANKVILYEGLPHQFFERAVLEKELANKKTVTFAEYPFYADTLELKQGDTKQLISLGGDRETYREFRGEKKCGGFHPDFALEFHVGKEKYYTLICFGCHEAIVVGPKTTVRTDLGEMGYKSLQAVLKDYKKNRPAPKD